MRLDYLKKGTIAMLVISQLASPAINSMAASPEFARSKEEWAMLRDNKLEWGEIEALVDEYNADVITNKHNFSKDERKLMDAEEIRGYLNDQADDLENMAAAAEAVNAVSAAQLRAQANAVREQADENVTDAEILRLGYEQIEAGIVLNVKNLYIDYDELLDKKPLIISRAELLEKQYKSAENRFNLGMITRVEVLNAREAYDNARAELITIDAAIDQAYRKLIVLCGWKYDSNAELAELPKADMEKINSIDFNKDMETALLNSYTLKMDRRKLENARNTSYDTSVIEKNEKKLKDDTDSISLQVKSSYDSLVSAKSDLEAAVKAAELQRDELKKAETQLGLGSISQMDFFKIKQDSLEKEAAVSTAERSLLKAEVVYEAAIAGITQQLS